MQVRSGVPDATLATVAPPAGGPVVPAKGPTAAQRLEDLRGRIGDCRRCALASGRTRLVFGVGNPKAELVFVGEGPGRDEDVQGEPFVGKAGQLLTKMIQNGMGLRREDVYICNVVKCRPPNNREPLPDEVASCRPFLEEQLKAISPKVICVLGNVAAKALLGDETRITRVRGKIFTRDGVTVVPTYHPSYLLRFQEAKKEAWEDLKRIMGILGLPIQKGK